jgi:transposase-like protein
MTVTYGQASPDRVNRRNGYRDREFDTRAGTLDLAVPKLRAGSYFPKWLRGAPQARRTGTDLGGGDLLPAGYSTRRMDKLVQSLGITTLSIPRSRRCPRNSTRTWRSSAPDRWSMPARSPSSPPSRWC